MSTSNAIKSSHHRSNRSHNSTGERPRGNGQRSPKMPDEPVEDTKRVSNGPNHYQIGQEIGRGGFAVVFQAFNVTTGGLVAVKRFPVNAIDKESLISIETEIELMQKLNHPNIVKYYDTIRTKHYLYIVLEFMENGSLATVIKKFGSFIEPLASIYISQVLSGLKYLHEQGVLHRDIKAANILTSKDGLVKLADFGVAMKQSEAHADDQDVVGSPYWIAPEIIEMSAPTAACDIWSVGCVVIELLTGKPPHFDLAPMAALFRIVSDDYPPIPEGISQALRDFLLLCFQKDPFMRSSAAKLLEHPWIMNSSQQTKLELTTKLLESRSTEQRSNDAENVVVNTIRTYQRDLKPLLEEEVAKARLNLERQKTSNSDAFSSDSRPSSIGSDRKRRSLQRSENSPGPSSPSKARHRRSQGFSSDAVKAELVPQGTEVTGNSTSDATAQSMAVDRAPSNDSAEDTAKFSGSALRRMIQRPSASEDSSPSARPPATPSAGAKGGFRMGHENMLSNSSSYSQHASPALTQQQQQQQQGRHLSHVRDLAISPETSAPPTPVGQMSGSEASKAFDNIGNVSSGSGSGSGSRSSDVTPPLNVSQASARGGSSHVSTKSSDESIIGIDSSFSISGASSASTAALNIRPDGRANKHQQQARAALSMSSDMGSSSSVGGTQLPRGMKAISEDFDDRDDNWDADFLDSELNISPDDHDHDILPSNSSRTVFSILDDRNASKSKRVGHLATIPSVINMNSKSESFTFNTSSANDSGRHIKSILNRSGSSDFADDVITEGADAVTLELGTSEELTPPARHGMSLQVDSSSASITSPTAFSPRKASRDKSLNSAPMRASSYRSLSVRTSSNIAVTDRLTLPVTPASSVLIGSQQHNSFMLMKFQEQPEEEDFDDFAEEEENLAVLATPRQVESVLDKPKGKKKFTIGTARSASTDTINDEDFDLDCGEISDGKAANFSDMIKNIQRNNAGPSSRPVSFNRQINRDMSLQSSTSIEEDNSFDDFEVADDGFAGNQPLLAARLKQRMKRLTKDAPEDEVDAFINYQFDEKDFKQNEHKDEHFRRSREVVEIMMRIRSELRTKEVIDLCGQLISIFTQFPEQREHLVTYHGVMPIVDMFEARNATQIRAPLTTNNRDKSLYVMRVVNKIIDGSTRTQEQLSLVGIIPTVMGLFERTYKTIGAFGSAQYGTTQDFSSTSTSSDATPDNSRHINVSEGTSSNRLPPKHQYMASADEEVDPLTLEAAHFIHQISSSSSLTLQMLIGAGGLSVLTNMVSFGATLNSIATAVAASAAAANLNSPSAVATVSATSLNERVASSSFSSTLSKPAGGQLSSKGIATTAEESVYDLAELITEQQLSEDALFNGTNNVGGVAANSVPMNNSPTTTMIAGAPEDFRRRFQIFQMGIDCILEVFAVQSSRTRDFCRLFVKLGLLPPLALSFQNVLAMYTTKMLQEMLPAAPGSTTPGGSSPSDSFHSPVTSSKHHRRKPSGSSQDLYLPHLESDESVERKYADHIAMLFYKFSRSDSIVVETMVKADQGVINVIIAALQAPELRYSSHPNSTVNSQAQQQHHSHNSSINSDSLSQSLSMLNLSTADNSSGSLRLKSPRQAASAVNLLERRMRSLSGAGISAFGISTRSMLTPAYMEIVELLLKCMNRLSMEPSALNDLENAGTIETLIPLLGGPMSDRCKSHIMQCMFYMCRINKRRQEKAANLGIVPHLKNVITAGSPHRQFALPIIFDLAHTSNETREELWKNECVPFYLDMLKENYWQSFAVNSVATWLASDPSRVSGLLVEHSQLLKLIEFFRTVSTQTIHSLHKPLLDMMFKPKDLSRELGCSTVYVVTLVKRLKNTSEAIVLRSLLRMLQLMHQEHPSPEEWVEQHNLVAVVREFAQSEGQVLVCQLANKLLLEFTEGDADA